MPETKQTLDKMVSEVFELYRVIAIARSRQPSGPDDLSEAEFLTLDLLTKNESLTIGEIQKKIGVLPAQMSRIVRSLEEQGGRGYVDCRINHRDRRRIDVSLSDAGRKAYTAYRDARLGSMYAILSALNGEDRLNFMRILRQIRQAFEDKIKNDKK